MTDGIFDFEQYRESGAKRFLRRLKQGPVRRTDLIAMNHRFSAFVKDLRLKGHTIDRVTDEGREDLYVWRRFVPQIRVTPEMQTAYYRTEHWKRTRAVRLKFDDHKCCHCKSLCVLQVHHWHYDLFAEAIEDLTTLCRTCHARIHETQLVTVHFPRYVPQEIGKRLEAQP